MRCFRHLLLLCLALLLALPAPVSAQEPPPALVVRLRDGDGRGVPNIAVLVLDTAGATVLARATTKADGSAGFGPLPLAEVRVRVEGRLPAGTALQLPGEDAAGIQVILGAPSVRLELRSEADGTVLPDPALELALETGVASDGGEVFDDAVILPAPAASAALAITTDPMPTVGPALLSPSASPLFSGDAPPPIPPPVSRPMWPAVLVLSLLLLAIGLVLLRLSRELRP